METNKEFVMLKPSFDDGTILKQQMLEALRDFPKKILDVYFSEFGDGIISGFELSVEDSTQTVIVSPGIYKHNDKVYVSENKLSINLFDEKNNIVYLEPERKKSDSGVNFNIKLTIHTNSEGEIRDEDKTTEMFELFRCSKDTGAKIFKIQKLDDVVNNKGKVPHNHLNQNYVLFSYCGGSGFSRDYLKLYASYVLNSGNCSAFDVAFACQCLNGLHDFDLIEKYFGPSDKSFSNEDIISKIKDKKDRLSRKTECSVKHNVQQTNEIMIID